MGQEAGSEICTKVFAWYHGLFSSLAGATRPGMDIGLRAYPDVYAYVRVCPRALEFGTKLLDSGWGGGGCRQAAKRGAAIDVKYASSTCLLHAGTFQAICGTGTLATLLLLLQVKERQNTRVLRQTERELIPLGKGTVEKVKLLRTARLRKKVSHFEPTPFLE